jgi:hypothetical protein
MYDFSSSTTSSSSGPSSANGQTYRRRDTARFACSGTQFDSEIASIFLSVKDTIKVQRGSPAAEWLEGEVSDEDPRPVVEN